MEEDEHDKLSENLELLFFELPKLAKQVKEYLTGERALAALPIELKWCIYLKYKVDTNAAGLINELCEQEEGIMRADRALKKISRDEEQWARALFREKASMDYRSGMNAARRVGREEGLAQGEAKGREEAEEKARLEKLEAARKLKARGFSDEEIAGILQIAIGDIAGL
jgi:flagellar biosynthesis/type III secretory pathway protein FliH